MGARPGGVCWLDLRDAYHEALETGRLEAYRRRRWGRAAEFGGWLAQAELPSLSMEQALALYRASGGNRVAEFKSNTVAEIRDALDFLLYDTIKLEGRFQECAADDGGYRLAGAGKEFVSYVLCVRDPALFAVWNFNTERGLRWLLGLYAGTLRQGPLGVRYVDLLEGLRLVCQRLGLGDFRAVDELFYAAARNARTGPR